jgi:hypothetical protein
MPRPLYPWGKSPWYPLDRRLGGPQSHLDDVEKRKFFTLPGLELRTLGHLACIQCTVLKIVGHAFEWYIYSFCKICIISITLFFSVSIFHFLFCMLVHFPCMCEYFAVYTPDVKKLRFFFCVPINPLAQERGAFKWYWLRNVIFSLCGSIQTQMVLCLFQFSFV